MRIPLLFLLLTASAAERPELEPEFLTLAKDAKDVSGIAEIGGTTYLVADGGEDHYLYGTALKGARFPLKKAVDLSAFAGFKEYVASLAAETKVPEKDRRLDLEGIAACGTTVYAVNERVRHVLVLDTAKKTLARLDADLSGYADLYAGESNAGFEGIAADCAGKTLYVAKERDPRQILVLKLDPGAPAKASLANHFDVAPSDRAGQQVINPFTGQGLLPINPDFADLFFENGFLFALERNSYEIAKIDVAKQAVVGRVSYLKTERGLYETGEPFGVAESLLLTKDDIRVGFDNNGAPLGVAAGKKAKVAGAFPGFYVYKRPTGF